MGGAGMPSYLKEENEGTAGPSSGHTRKLDLQLALMEMISCLCPPHQPQPPTLHARRILLLPFLLLKIYPSFKAKVRPPLRRQEELPNVCISQLCVQITVA